MRSNKLIDDVKIITPKRFEDARGHFSETWNKRRFLHDVGDIDFVQDNHSLSTEMHTLRGLHFQAPPHGQAKLVRVVRGAVFDVAVDWRKGSPNFGDWVGVELSAQNGNQLFIPDGFLHGFLTLEPMTEVVYKCSTFYAPESDGSIRFDDPDLGIDWGLPNNSFVLSEKDEAAAFVSDMPSPFEYEGQK